MKRIAMVLALALSSGGLFALAAGCEQEETQQEGLYEQEGFEQQEGIQQEEGMQQEEGLFQEGEETFE